MGNAPGSQLGMSGVKATPNETGVYLTCGEAKMVGTAGAGGYCRYTFLCGYGPFSWEVHVRFSEVRACPSTEGHGR